MSNLRSQIENPQSLAGRRVLVMGLGRFGGGVGVSRWLAEQGALVTVTDMASRDDLAGSIKALGELPITLHLGGHEDADLAACELLVVNPAVDKAKSAYFAEAVRRGVPWTSENNLFLERCPGTLVGITGSVGKSTTTAMIGEALAAALTSQSAAFSEPRPSGSGGRSMTRASNNAESPLPYEFENESRGTGFQPVMAGSRTGRMPVPREKFPLPHGRGSEMQHGRGSEMQRRVWVGGNIGKSLLSSLGAMTPRDVVVLELSSFQLEDAGVVRRSPNVALITNLRPNHLDRHVTMEAYAAAKRNIFAYQRAGDVAITPAGDELCGHRFTPPADVRTVWFDVDEAGRPRWGAESVDTIRTFEVSLAVPGLHNRLNAAAALAVLDALKVPLESARPGLENFAGLPHRLEFVREVGGVRYYNDSKATTPDAAITALLAFERPVVMLCGGYDKELPFEKLGQALAGRAKAVICMGATREKIFNATRQAQGDRGTPTIKSVTEFREGVSLARQLARPGDVVVLAPGCASYDAFKNYEERGETFKMIVNGM